MFMTVLPSSWVLFVAWVKTSKRSLSPFERIPLLQKLDSLKAMYTVGWKRLSAKGCINYSSEDVGVLIHLECCVTCRNTTFLTVNNLKPSCELK